MTRVKREWLKREADKALYDITENWETGECGYTGMWVNVTFTESIEGFTDEELETYVQWYSGHLWDPFRTVRKEKSFYLHGYRD